MQTFGRGNIHTHCVDDDYPRFLGRVRLGEPFVLETERSRIGVAGHEHDGNKANGPVEVEGVKAGDDLAIHVEAVEVAEPMLAPNGGPFDAFAAVPLDYRDGYLCFPRHFRVKARPSIGNVAVLPRLTPELGALLRRPHGLPGWRRLVNDPRGKFCHQDCPWTTAASVVRMKAQIDGGGVCVADVHAYAGAGELAFDGVGAAAAVRLRVERSEGWLVDWPLVETKDEIMVCTSGQRYVSVVREAFRALREVVAARAGCTVEEANALVASAIDLRNCAIYGLGDGYLPGTEGQPSGDLAVVGAIPKDVFVD